MKRILAGAIPVFSILVVLSANWLVLAIGGISVTYAKSSKTTIVKPSKLINESSACQDQEDSAQTDSSGNRYYPVELQDPAPDCGHIAWFMKPNITVGKTCDFSTNFFNGPAFAIDLVGTNNHHYITTAGPSAWTSFPDVHEIDTVFDSNLSGQTVNVGSITVSNCKNGCNGVANCGQSISNPNVTINSHACGKNHKTSCTSAHGPTTAISNRVVQPTLTRNCDPDTDTLTPGDPDPTTHSTFQILSLGGAPNCDTVTWDFSSQNIAGLSCRFGMSPLNQTLTLDFIDPDNQQIDTWVTTPDQIPEKSETNVQKVQLEMRPDMAGQQIMLGAIWFDSCH